MGAISDLGSLDVLRKYAGHQDRSIRETCEIAIAKIEWDNSPEGKAGVASYVQLCPTRSRH